MDDPFVNRREYGTAALTSAARRQVLDALRASPLPLDAATVAEGLGLHITTARFHLDHLCTAGLASRSSGTEKRRGRPRILYAPAGSVRDEDSREQLIHVLAGALAEQDPTGTDSVDAGRRWADSFDPIVGDPISGLVGVLDRLGFDPESDGTQIRLRACPFRDAAREHPQVVCSVHRGLIEQVLEPTSARSQLVPFLEPALCLVVLESVGPPPSAGVPDRGPRLESAAG